MKYLVFGVLALCACVQASEPASEQAPVQAKTPTVSCSMNTAKVSKKWQRNNTDGDTCIEFMIKQVAKELSASLTYLQMGAHFSQDSVNKHGFANFFFEAANEEREHAIQFIKYLSMRGALPNAMNAFIKEEINPVGTTWLSGTKAMQAALALEISVTASIRAIIKACEETPDTFGGNDYHLVDYLTGEFLEEQYKGQRDLAGKISILTRMEEHHGALNEFLFDKKLLSGEPLL